MDFMKGIGLKISIFTLCLILGIGFAKIYQPQSKTFRIYKQALKDYENKNYSNAYFLFSRVGYASNLKPYALYRQAMCAKSLGDKQSELSSYQKLITYFPKNELISEAKYQAGQLLVEDNPGLAMRYFNSVKKSKLGEDYQVAADYYKARITTNQVRYLHKKINPTQYKETENAFRTYLKDVPDGRLAASVAETWHKFNPKTPSKDTVLMARAYYKSGMYERAAETLNLADEKDRWAVEASNAYMLHDYKRTKALVEDGIEKYSEDVTPEDYDNAINDYLKLYDPKDKLLYTTKLLSSAKGDKKAYIWYLKCENAPTKDKFACHKDLYLNFPESKYAEKSLMQVFQYGIKNKNYQTCRALAKDFLNSYPNSEYAPYFLFWAGKIEQSYGNVQYTEYFQKLINKYPDSYQAYRAFWILRGITSATINADIYYRPVEYPYQYPARGETLYNLLQVQDYTLVSKVVKDEFIDSWIEYQKGNYTESINIARKAMSKLTEKPVKSDLRWRLLYPLNYYKQVKNYSDQYANNDALMMGIIRTESTFNPEAQSPVGAIGLMQLMPSTAHDIGAKHGITEFNTSYLFNPELNIKLGNIYYSTIRNMLDKKDVSAVAAYNGGIGAVTKWKSNLKYNDTDEFVEQIPYEETKNYVERVFQSYWNYSRIYQR